LINVLLLQQFTFINWLTSKFYLAKVLDLEYKYYYCLVHDKYLLPRIIKQPQSQIAQTGGKVFFKCDYDIITLTSTLAISTYIQIKWL
jgi:hypothetical protein